MLKFLFEADGGGNVDLENRVKVIVQQEFIETASVTQCQTPLERRRPQTQHQYCNMEPHCFLLQIAKRSLKVEASWKQHLQQQSPLA